MIQYCFLSLVDSPTIGRLAASATERRRMDRWDLPRRGGGRAVVRAGRRKWEQRGLDVVRSLPTTFYVLNHLFV